MRSLTQGLVRHAYDRTIEDLKFWGVSVSDAMKSTITAAILAAVDDGQRDANQLVQRALDATKVFTPITDDTEELPLFRAAVGR